MPARASWGTGFHGHICRDRHSQSRLWRGVALGPPGPAKPEEVLSGAASVSPGPAWPTEPLGGHCLGSQGPVQPEEALVGAGLRTGTHAAHRGFGGGRSHAWDLRGQRRPWRGAGLRPGTLAGLPGLEGWASLLRCVPPPLPKEGGQQGAPQRWPCSLHATQHRCPTSLVAQVPPQPSGHGTFPPATPGHLLTANSYPLPGSTLQNLLSGTQLPSPLGGTQPRPECAGPQPGPRAQAPLFPSLHRPIAALLSIPLSPRRSPPSLLIPRHEWVPPSVGTAPQPPPPGVLVHPTSTLFPSSFPTTPHPVARRPLPVPPGV